MAKTWAKFPYVDKKYVYSAATLKKAWDDLHRGDCEPFPKDAAVVEAWIAFHAGDFKKAAELGLKAGGAGITAANKATAIHANYLEEDDKNKPGRFLEEVVSENIGYLSSLPGIGKKSAQRIVLELKERIAKRYTTRGVKRSVNISEDAVAALMALGYAETHARRAVGAVKAETVEDLIRSALKELIR